MFGTNREEQFYEFSDAVQCGDYELASRILSVDQSFALVDSPNLLGTAFDAKMAALLLAAGASVNPSVSGGESALHIAAHANRTEIVGVLLDHGADINARNEAGNTPLFEAVVSSENFGETVSLLRERGAVVDLQTAVVLGDVETVGRLLQENPLEIESCPRFGDLIFMAVVESNVRWQRSDIDGGDRSRRAFAEDIRPILLSLIAHGVDINGLDSSQEQTPLHFAALFGSLPLVELLLSLGASAEVYDGIQGKTPLDMATDEDIVQLLRQHMTGSS